MDAKLGQSLVDTIEAINSKVDQVSGKQLSTNDYTTTEKNKLAGIASGAQVNQNTFTNIIIGSDIIQPDSTSDSLTLVAGDNISLSANTSTDTITISATGGGSSGSTKSYSSYPIKRYLAAESGNNANYYEWTPSVAGYYDLTAWGAAGCVSNDAATYNVTYGKGAALSGRFYLTTSDTLLIIVGQIGVLVGTPSSGATDLTSGGGGGCTIIAKLGSNSNSNLNFTHNNTPFQLIMLAAGGGGTSDCTYRKTSSKSGGDGRATDGYLATPSNLLTKGINLSSLSAKTYTRANVTVRGGYPCGDAQDDNSAKGGAWGWSTSEPYIGTSFLAGELIDAADGVNDGEGKVQISIALDPFTSNLEDPDKNSGTFNKLSDLVGKSVKDNSAATPIASSDSLVTERTIYYGLPKINNNHSYDSSDTYYAPISGGTSGYFLKSNGSTSEPTWTQNIITLVNGSSTTGKSIYAPTSYGTSGYKLVSQGSGSSPTWKSCWATTQIFNGTMQESKNYSLSTSVTTTNFDWVLIQFKSTASTIGTRIIPVSQLIIDSSYVQGYQVESSSGSQMRRVTIAFTSSSQVRCTVAAYLSNVTIWGIKQ